MGTRPNLLHHSLQRQDGKSKPFPHLSLLYPPLLLALPKLQSKSLKVHQIISARTLELLKTYVTDTSLNTAAITPKKDFVILGGGQAAENVTTTSSRQGKFEARFYHRIFEDEIGRVKGHFGPLNTIAVDPMGREYASGGE